MIKKIFALTLIFTMNACATEESKVEEYLRKNPKVVFDIIEQNPEQFMEAVNKAARKAQEAQFIKQNLELKRQQNDQLKNPLKPVLTNGSLLFGSSKAPIVIVEYADFQCPACRMAYDSLMKIKDKFKGQVQIHYKHMPLDFHKMAMPAAKYYEAVKSIDKDKAEKFYKLTFENQEQLKNEDFLKKIVKQIGVNENEVNKKISSTDVENIITSDSNEFQKFGFTGTPVIIVNGIALHGAQPVDEIERVIQITENNNRP